MNRIQSDAVIVRYNLGLCLCGTVIRYGTYRAMDFQRMQVFDWRIYTACTYAVSG